MYSFDKFLKKLQEDTPKFNIKYKNESKFMKFLGALLFFNKGFMTKYVTTIGSTVYYPDKLFIEKEKVAIEILAHEFVHTKDSNKSFLFSPLYLFPQILAPFMLFFMFASIWLGLGLFALFILPLPAPFRMHYEVRGYTMSLFMINKFLVDQNKDQEERRKVLYDIAGNINKNFTSFAYYLMWPFGVTKKLKQNIDKIVSNKILEEGQNYKLAEAAFNHCKE